MVILECGLGGDGYHRDGLNLGRLSFYHTDSYYILVAHFCSILFSLKEIDSIKIGSLSGRIY